MKRSVLGLVLAWLATCSLRGANAGDEVVVVFNSRVPASKALAEFYAQHRQVPKNQVVGFDLTSSEEISRAEFRDSLQKPLAKALSSKKLWRVGSQIVRSQTNQTVRFGIVESKIRYAVLCYGIPLRIEPDPNLKEAAMEQLRPELRRNEACVDSELALLPEIEQRLPLAGPLSNPVYGATNTALLHPTNGVLLVTRLDGIDEDIARGLVNKAIEAEDNGLWGRAYIDLRNIKDPAYKPGDDWIRNAGEICRRLGFETTVDENPETFPTGFPMSQIAFYVGWYAQDANGPFSEPTIEFMPGAFAYHLHSLSAVSLRSKTQGWAGPMLAKGATATMGCVYEPYLAGTPDIAVFVARWVFSGFTFAEAAYASQTVLSWQTTVVGDPLYRPFARKPQRQHEDLARRDLKLIEWSHLRVVDLNLASGYPVDDVINYLERLPLTRQSALLKEKLADLYLAGKKLSFAMGEYEAALSLNPTPQQKIRLILTLTRVQTLYGRDKQAYDWYQKFLKEFPDYPDLLGIYRKMLPLAETVGTKEDVEKYQQEIKRLSPPVAPAKP